MNKTWPDHLPIWSDPERLGGAPCFLHTRVPVDALFANLADGVSLDEFLDAFEGVKREDALAVLSTPENSSRRLPRLLFRAEPYHCVTACPFTRNETQSSHGLTSNKLPLYATILSDPVA